MFNDFTYISCQSISVFLRNHVAKQPKYQGLPLKVTTVNLSVSLLWLWERLHLIPPNCLQKLWYEQFSTWNAYQAFLVAAHAITWYPYLRISIWLNISCILLVHFMLDVIYFSLANSQLELTLFTTQAQKNMFWRYFRNLFWSAIDFIFP